MASYEDNVYNWLKKAGYADKYEHAGIYCIKIDHAIVYIGRMLRLPLLFETMEQGQGAAHERDNAAAVCGLWGINNKSASGCVSDVALNLNHGAGRVNVPPFKSHTFAAPQTRCNQQMEHTTELQGAGIKSLEKGGCVLL